MEEITVEYVKQQMKHVFRKIDEDRETSFLLKKKLDDGKYLQLITAKLRVIFGKIPTFKNDELEQYYFENDKGLARLQAKYQFILELQDMICFETGLPFIYDRFTILKILRISMNRYNEIIDNCNDNNYIFDEDIANLFVDIETMLLSDRNTSAENGTKNFKAIDSINKYKKSSGGFGVLIEKEHDTSNNGKVFVISAEETQKKLHNFNFSNLLENSEQEEKKKLSSGAINKKSKK